jgi:pyruvate formate lyase activating enzyme
VTGGVVECDFCAHRCRIAPGGTGICGVRRNDNGTLVTTVYGRIQSAAIDPIEKKPLYHFLPGTRVFSVALAGCNFRCRFCQNASIAFPEAFPRPRAHWTPEETVAAWRESETPTIAYTYSEPTVWQDFILDTAPLVRAEGGRVVMVTNGFFTPEALDRLLPVVDAFNVDLKGDDAFYRELCGGRGGPVLEAIRRIAPARHLEVTTMLMPSRHTEEILDTLRGELVAAGVKVWHLSRFFPAWKMADEPATSERDLRRALDFLAEREAPPFIFAGNSRQSEYHLTVCPACDTVCIDHRPPVRDDTVDGRCPACGAELYGVFY